MGSIETIGSIIFLSLFTYGFLTLVMVATSELREPVLVPTPEPVPVDEAPYVPPTPCNIPEPYYLDITHGEKNITDLVYALECISYPHKYEEDVFDCSEMSSYVERELENSGFTAYIGVNYTADHAYVLVDIGTGNLVTVECTVEKPHIVYVFEPIYVPQQIYNNIYEACDVSCDAWDWWSIA